MENFNGDNSCILSLSVPLPEDIMKLKWAGEFEQACRVIDRRLKKKLPEELRRRLVLEKEILRRDTWSVSLHLAGGRREDAKQYPGFSG